VFGGIETLTILVDNDVSGTGQEAALKYSARWTGAGREVFRFIPRQLGADAHELVAGRVDGEHVVGIGQLRARRFGGVIMAPSISPGFF
jgi:hypothetical protein